MRKLLLGVLAGCVLLSGSAGRAESLSGSGSSLVAPLMSKWSKTYAKEKKDTVKYASTGSGAGVTAFAKKKVDFACSDVPVGARVLSKLELSAKDVVQVPLVLGGVVPVCNVPGLEKRPRFTGAVLADIYLGKIRKWNDPALVKLNPEARLPDRAIVVVYRSDSSGTSFLWTAYLGKVSKEAKTKIGVSSMPKWPVGVGARGNSGVVKEVAKTPGALGYSATVYGGVMEKYKKLKVGMVRNKAGKYVVGSPAAIGAAAAGAGAIPASPALWLIDRPGEKAYPIVGVVWALASTKPRDKAKALTAFLTWAVRDGQKGVDRLGYAPLPKAVVSAAEKRIRSIGAR
jgi:phosphate transport system substrate-binding protein